MDFVICEYVDMEGTISYLLLLLYHWMELNETFRESLLHVLIVHLLFGILNGNNLGIVAKHELLFMAL